MKTEECLPKCESVKSTKTDDYFLTHCIWHNSYGGSQPETGVRPVINGEVQKDFHLIQHGVRDFDFVEPIILRGLRKGWRPTRIGDFLQRFSNRNRSTKVMFI